MRFEHTCTQVCELCLVTQNMEKAGKKRSIYIYIGRYTWCHRFKGHCLLFVAILYFLGKGWNSILGGEGNTKRSRCIIWPYSCCTSCTFWFCIDVISIILLVTFLPWYSLDLIVPFFFFFLFFGKHTGGLESGTSHTSSLPLSWAWMTFLGFDCCNLKNKNKWNKN